GIGGYPSYSSNPLAFQAFSGPTKDLQGPNLLSCPSAQCYPVTSTLQCIKCGSTSILAIDGGFVNNEF
ncbi:hypothetical protein PanWU01x14_167000, partial [Parasponia andersonii]